MPTPEPQNLLCHPHSPATMVRAVAATAARTSDGGLVFSYQVSGDIVRLRIPEPQESGRSDGLWQHTCFEAFIAVAGDSAYRELNFSPSGQWAAYAFSGYRQLQESCAATTAPHVGASVSAGHLHLTATVAADLLPPGAAVTVLQIGLAAVIETADTVTGVRSHWALRHAEGLADFHRRETFILELRVA
jgi:hypothetical protein